MKTINVDKLSITQRFEIGCTPQNTGIGKSHIKNQLKNQVHRVVACILSIHVY